MKIDSTQKHLQGITLPETVVILVVLAILICLVIPPRHHTYTGANRISCINNLKQLGTAYRVWENDNDNLYPMQHPMQQVETNGGMKELLSGSGRDGPFAYLPYAIMQNELGQSPKVVLCPSDERAPNTNFYFGAQNAPPGIPFTNIGTFDNTNLSYFCGVGSLDNYPQSILAGDRNLGDEGDRYYGISGTAASPDGPCGADAIVNTNGQWVSAYVAGGGGSVTIGQPVSWSRKMHSMKNKNGAGNILLGDGSAQQCNSEGLRTTWLRSGTNLGNFATNDLIHSAASGDIRLLFP